MAEQISGRPRPYTWPGWQVLAVLAGSSHENQHQVSERQEAADWAGIGVETHFYSGPELRDMPGGLGST